MTMSAAITALVVAMAGIMLPAMAEREKKKKEERGGNYMMITWPHRTAANKTDI